jgi:sugar O-acyltransferase (sialic acid O-acetyltransferase NeuD family)
VGVFFFAHTSFAYEGLKGTKVTPIIGFGAGGHGRVLLETLLLRGEFEVVGFVDDNAALHAQYVEGIRVLGGKTILPELFGRGVRHVFMGVGGTGDNRPRAQMFNHLSSIGLQVVNVIHPTAVVSKTAVLGKGVAIMAGVVINCGAQIGNNVILNTGAAVDHDCQVGDHVHIAPGAVLSGGVRVGAYSHVGTGASVRQNVSIGAEAIVGVGAAVIADVHDRSTVGGVPARVLKAGISVSGGLSNEE